MNKITSLAIDSLTQFRAGVDKVRIGPIEIKGVEAFNWAGKYQKADVSDEDNLINGIESLIFSRLLTTLLRNREGITIQEVHEESNNLSVEWI